MNIGEVRHGEMSRDVVRFDGQRLIVPKAALSQITVFDVSFAQHVVQALRGVMVWPLGDCRMVKANRFLRIYNGGETKKDTAFLCT